MSDRFAAEVHIGGPIAKRLLRPLARIIAAAGASLRGYGDGMANEQEALDALREGAKVSLYNDQAPYGRMTRLEEFLLEHHIHFNRFSAAWYEHDAELAFYRGGKDVLYLYATQDARPLFSQEQLIRILKKELSDSRKLEVLHKLLEPPQMRPLQPIHWA